MLYIELILSRIEYKSLVTELVILSTLSLTFLQQAQRL